MIPGIVAAQTRVAAGGTLWTPLNMATVPQIYLDAEDSVITDVSGFASAISNLGAMGANGDFSQGTAGSRPAILAGELNGKRVLRFDGTDDRMQGASAAQKDIFRNVTSAWIYAVVKKRVADGTDINRIIAATSTGTSFGARMQALAGSSVAGGANKPAIYARRLDAGAFSSLVSASSIATSYYMCMFEVDYATRAGRIYTNGALAIENTTLIDTAGATSDTASQEAVVLGSFPDQTAGFADMDLAGIVMSNTKPSSSDIDKLFGWAAHKYGLTASLPGGHPYKTVAPTV